MDCSNEYLAARVLSLPYLCHPERSMTIFVMRSRGICFWASRAKQQEKQAKADLSASHEDFRPHASVEMTELPVDEQEL